jgi:hypothetical protein
MSTFVEMSQGTGLTWLGVMLGAAFIKSNAFVVVDHEEV